MRIGIALSSGGAAGMAHVGVIEELTAAGIEIDLVAGTSAGAMVGAAWASGHLEAFREIMCSLTRRKVIALFDPTWPRVGLLEGRRPLELIGSTIGERIEELPRPYAAVATDLVTGEEVVLRTGSVAHAIRASAAIPGLFTPETLDGRMLVDGGLVNPVPVDVARRLGADFIIAVTVLGITDKVPSEKPAESVQELAAQWLARLFPAAGRDVEPDSDGDFVVPPPDAEVDQLGLIEIISRASRLVQARLAEERLLLHPPDGLIRVPLPQFSLFDFDRSADAVEAGRCAARAALPAIRASLDDASSIPGRVSRWWKSPTGREAS